MQKLMLVILDLLSAITECETPFRNNQTGKAKPPFSTRRIISFWTIDSDDLDYTDQYGWFENHAI